MKTVYPRIDTVRVANGTVEIGDKIAVAVTSGYEGDGLRTGRVLGLFGVPAFSGGFKRYLVQVLVTGTSASVPVTSQAYVKTYTCPHRMVKL